MKYELEDLLRVRKIRKDKAADNVKKARLALKKAEDVVEAANRRLSEYKLFKVKEVERLYGAVMKKNVPKEGIENLQIELAFLDKKILEYETALQDAIEAHKKAQKYLDDRVGALQQATRNMQKIEEHKQTWIEEDSKILELSQDKELEDVKLKEDLSHE
ncbi:MAG: hypothetical protein A2007_02550 [Verrucomicrobia bacterium GWC2_42_7]|nr:MAG: hypothetical protein A2007_02550 [Verrucomicrobia bacterium GWC2_42_7]